MSPKASCHKTQGRLSWLDHEINMFTKHDRCSLIVLIVYFTRWSVPMSRVPTTLATISQVLAANFPRSTSTKRPSQYPNNGPLALVLFWGYPKKNRNAQRGNANSGKSLVKSQPNLATIDPLFQGYPRVFLLRGLWRGASK